MMDIPFIVLEKYRITIQHYLDGREIEPPIGIEYCFNAGEIPRSIIVNKMMKKMKGLMLEEARRAEPPKGE